MAKGGAEGNQATPNHWHGNVFFLYEDFDQQPTVVCCCPPLSLFLLFSYWINCFYAFVVVGKFDNTYPQDFFQVFSSLYQENVNYDDSL